MASRLKTARRQPEENKYPIALASDGQSRSPRAFYPKYTRLGEIDRGEISLVPLNNCPGTVYRDRTEG